jgi:predicted esterase
MGVESFYIEIPRTARYFVSGKWDPPPPILWFVLHGYSQLAPDFIQLFKIIEGTDTLVVAPEGLSRFYVKGYFGQVGASWMTKVERMAEINDYIRYLDRVYESVIERTGSIPQRVIVFGFSQGGAAAVRWAVMSSHRIHDLIIHSSEFPADLDEELVGQFSHRSCIHYVYGSHDEFMDEEQFEKEMERLRALQISFIPWRFEGRHEIKPEILSQLKSAMSIR